MYDQDPLLAELHRQSHLIPRRQTFAFSLKVDITFTPTDPLHNEAAARVFEEACDAGMATDLLRYTDVYADEGRRAVLLKLRPYGNRSHDRQLNRLYARLSKWFKEDHCRICNAGVYTWLLSFPEDVKMARLVRVLEQEVSQPVGIFPGILRLVSQPLPTESSLLPRQLMQPVRPRLRLKKPV